MPNATASFSARQADPSRIDLGTIPRSLLSILHRHAAPMSADELHRELTRQRHEATLAAVYKAIAKLRDYELIASEPIRTNRQAMRALDAARDVAARLRGETTPKGGFVARFEITHKGDVLDAALALDVAGGLRGRKRQSILRRFLRAFLG